MTSYRVWDDPSHALHAPSLLPPEIIAHAVWLPVRFPLSLRLVEDMLLQRGIIVSYETIRCRAAKLSPDHARRSRRRTASRTDVWHLDEVVITISGQQHWPSSLSWPTDGGRLTRMALFATKSCESAATPKWPNSFPPVCCKSRALSPSASSPTSSVGMLLRRNTSCRTSITARTRVRKTAPKTAASPFESQSGSSSILDRHAPCSAASRSSQPSEIPSSSPPPTLRPMHSSPPAPSFRARKSVAAAAERPACGGDCSSGAPGLGEAAPIRQPRTGQDGRLPHQTHQRRAPTKFVQIPRKMG